MLFGCGDRGEIIDMVDLIVDRFMRLEIIELFELHSNGITISKE